MEGIYSYSQFLGKGENGGQLKERGFLLLSSQGAPPSLFFFN